MPNSNLPTRYYNPQTGQEIIIYDKPPMNLPPPQQEPQHPVVVYQQPQVPYPYHHPNQRPKRQRHAERKGRLVGGFFLWFILSWIPCGMGFPGLTLLCWGISVAYLLYRAVKAV